MTAKTKSRWALAGPSRLPCKGLLSLALGLVMGAAHAQETLTYAQGATAAGPHDLRLDLYPAASTSTCDAPRPTVVFLHGGGFVNGGKGGKRPKTMARAFNQAGMNLISIEYRLVPDQPIPSPAYSDFVEAMGQAQRQDGQRQAAAAALEDAVTALEFAVKQAETYCIDVDHLFISGSSAGGVIALNVAYSLDDAGISRPDLAGVINMWGGFLPEDAMEQGDIPLFTAHGERDRTVTFDWAERHWAMANATGTPMQLHAFIRERHGFDIGRTRVEGVRLVDLMVRFVESIVAGNAPETLRTRS